MVFRLPALNRNVRNEIKKGKKVYFYDCGIRNAIIDNFRPVQSRDDAGALWENFVIAEHMKLQRYRGQTPRFYFWRTTQQQEIDLIEETEDGLNAFEIKWNPAQKVRFSQTFTDHYPNAKTFAVSPKTVEAIIASPQA